RLLELPLAALVALQAPEAARTPVAYEIDAVERGELAAAIDAAADHADAVLLVTVFGHGQDADDGPLLSRFLLLDRERMDAAHPVPAVVLAALRGSGLEVDLFPDVLADVGDVEVARFPVERERPRVADAVGPDLRLGLLLDLREFQLALAE